MNNEKTLLCPFRKETIKSCNRVSEYFLPCLGKDCAWYSNEKKQCDPVGLISGRHYLT